MKGWNGTTTPEDIRDCWRTPEFIFNHYDKRFNFAHDLASSDENHYCNSHTTDADSGLDFLNVEMKGFGNGAIWCNPPYSDIMPWVEQCIALAWCRPVVMLIPADTSVKWFKKAFDNCTECQFIAGRVSFVNAATGVPVNGNNKGSVVFIFSPDGPMQRVSMVDRESMR